MSGTAFRRLDDLFNQALDSDPAARAALLAGIEIETPELAARLRAMLSAAAADNDPLRASIARAAHALEPPMPACIGPFAVLRRLGEGGMGTVFLCQRSDGDFTHLLAVKRLSQTFGNAAIRERLKLERRLLARLRHPHIAQFIDGGEDADGTPYVAMEYVDGAPIVRHVIEQSFDRRARVQLFQQLCSAVQFAHGNLIVHRDLKPDNVLVDRHGQVKLLDFGIAKLLGDGDTAVGNPLPTMAAAMTPHYASPEQIRGEPVSQASDIYSLGVLLYELLSGQRPYALDTTRPAEIERIVCEQEPVPPSRVAAWHGAEVRDLDAIVGKAMHKQAERRYASVAQLSEDLERWLEGQPVRARPDSRAYRVHTFLRRHPLGTAAGALLLLLLVAFAAAMAWQAERVARERDSARREARVAKETADFLIDLFGASDPRVADPANLRARDLLDAAAERLPTALASDPLARARLLHTIGLAFANMGDDTRGTALLADALALRKQHAGTDSSEVADSLNRLGNIHRQFGRLAEAEPMLLRALDWRTRNGPVDADLADSYNNLGLLQNDMGQYEEAESTLRRAIALHRQVAGDASNSVASPLHNLAIALRAQKRFEEARAAALESLQRKRSADERSASVANTLAVLANIERELGGLDAAVTHSSESLVLRRAVFGNDSLMIASGLITHAGVLAALERNAEAEALFDEALALHQRTGDADSAAAARTYLAYGRFLLARGSAPRALILIERAHAIVVAGLPPGAQVPASYAQALAAARLATGP